MNFIFSPALQDVVSGLRIDVEKIPAVNGFQYFEIFDVDGVFLLNRARFRDLKEYSNEIGAASMGFAAMDLELRENRVALVGEVERFDCVGDAIRRGIEGAFSVYEFLCQSTQTRDWVIWLSIDNQLGEYEATVEDLISVSLEEIVDRQKPWWFSFDISFGRARRVSDHLWTTFLSSGWGQSLSPLQAIYAPEFVNQE